VLEYWCYTLCAMRYALCGYCCEAGSYGLQFLMLMKLERIRNNLDTEPQASAV